MQHRETQDCEFSTGLYCATIEIDTERLALALSEFVRVHLNERYRPKLQYDCRDGVLSYVRSSCADMLEHYGSDVRWD